MSVFAPGAPAMCPLSKYSTGFVDMQRQVGWRAAHSRWADWIAIDRVAGSPEMHDRTYIIWQSDPIEPERFARLAGEVAEQVDPNWHSELLLREPSVEYVNAVRSGFPFRCALGWVEYRSQQGRPVYLLGDTSTSWWRCKPVDILPVPFLLNVSIYAGLAYTAWLVLGLFTRGVLRRTTGPHCGLCGYDLSGSMGPCCPECGGLKGQKRPNLRGSTDPDLIATVPPIAGSFSAGGTTAFLFPRWVRLVPRQDLSIPEGQAAPDSTRAKRQGPSVGESIHPSPIR